jgi:hypothetical protein
MQCSSTEFQDLRISISYCPETVIPILDMRVSLNPGGKDKSKALLSDKGLKNEELQLLGLNEKH